MVGIYKITNRINKKCYIGQSVNIEIRFSNHKSTAFNPNDENYEYPLYRAIRKYGLENFIFEILEECAINELDEKEKLYIAKYQSHGPLGYNQDDGGFGGSHNYKLTEDDVSRIISKLRNTNKSLISIGKEFGISDSAVGRINRGLARRREEEIYPIRSCKNERLEKPSKLELAKLIKECGFTKVGLKFNVNGNTIKHWCKIYKIPHKLKELIAWYNEQTGVIELPKQKMPSYKSTKIKQINPMTNEVVCIFDSIGKAAKAFHDGKTTNISRACKGERKTAYGYRWEYA